MQTNVLLLEPMEEAKDILSRQLRDKFPDISFDAAGSTEEALRLAQTNTYDIVICGEDVAQEPEVLCDICKGKGDICIGRCPLLVVISGHTKISKEKYPPHLKNTCLFAVVHKPLTLWELFQTVELAIEEAKTRRG